MGKGRATTKIEAFRITKYPVLVGEWKRCVADGSCSLPAWQGGACAIDADGLGAMDGPTVGAEIETIPITCVTLKQAQSFCEWAHHGHVATAEEWMMAARGPTVRRFPWGDTRQGCSHRWRLVFSPDVPGACCQKDCANASARVVAAHPEGESPFGVADVLATHAELVAPSAGANGQASCAKHGCVITGLEPSAIDWVLAAPQDRDEEVPFAAGFRCAWAEEVVR